MLNIVQSFVLPAQAESVTSDMSLIKFLFLSSVSSFLGHLFYLMTVNKLKIFVLAFATMMDPLAHPAENAHAAVAKIIHPLAAPVYSVHAASLSVDQKIKSCCNWDTTDFPVVVSTSLTDDKPLTINLIETFGGTGRVGKLMKEAGVKVFWLPKELNNCDKPSRLRVYQHFSHSAMKNGGFALRINGWKEKRQLVMFECIRGSWYEPPRPKKAPSALVEG
jgi:hypothetical protein